MNEKPSEVLALANNLLSQKNFYLGSNHHETLESEWQSALLAAEIARANDFESDDFVSQRPAWVKPIKEFPQRYSNMYGKNHPVSISRLSEYASHCRIARLYTESKILHKKAYKLASESLAKNELVFSQVRIQYTLLLTTLANRGCPAATSARYRLEALRFLEDEWQIQTKASSDSSDLSILQSQINLVELCVESGLDQRAFGYLTNLVNSATLKLGCDHPIIQDALMAISDLGYLPGFDGAIDFSIFYQMIFNVCEWILDHSFVVPLITLNDIILVSCSKSQQLHKGSPSLANALTAGKRNAGQDSSLLLNDLSTLAWIENDFGRAIEMLTKVIESPEIRDYASDQVRLCLLEKLGVFLRDAGEYTRSIACFDQTCNLRRSRRGDYAFDSINSAIQLASSKHLSGNPKAISDLIDYFDNNEDRAFPESLHPCSRHLILSLFPDEALRILGSIETTEQAGLYASLHFECPSVYEISAAVDLASHLSRVFPL
jgi:hypothetical protein